jgi:acetyl esterase/lipase
MKFSLQAPLGDLSKPSPPLLLRGTLPIPFRWFRHGRVGAHPASLFIFHLSSFIIVFLLLGTSFAQSTHPTPIPLSPTTAPDAPTLTPFLLPSPTTHPAILIFPGGSYTHYGIHESLPVAHYFNSQGYNAFLLHYSLGPKHHYPTQLEDAQTAIRYVRAHATDFNIDPTHVAVIGFSAGGHLAAMLATHSDPGNPTSPDPLTRVSSRPDAVLLIYPVITMLDPYTHKPSRIALLGDAPSPKLEQETSAELHVTSATPPCFLVHAIDDHTAPVQNTLLFAQSLQAAGVPYELHIFDHGKHAFALGVGDPELSQWPTLCVRWLTSRGFSTH